ncbi:MAG: hypothetical protein Q9220_007771 [cf. Caloplaca sp. 1 TL-2023]
MSQTTLKQPQSEQLLSYPVQAVEKDDLDRVPSLLPDQVAEEVSKLPKLTRQQCGHLRHFHNLATQPDGDWSLMGSATGQDHDESFRYQMAFMGYAAGAAHYHRLPALRSVFKGLMHKLILKMLHRDVWSYWYLTSQSGIKLDPDLKELRKPWADPVCKENVMYSGHLLLMVSLYSMLFADDHYDEPNSIVFDWAPLFWGMGPERFSYTRTTLQQTILGQMEKSGWMGACCEPNLVFIVCNQFPRFGGESAGKILTATKQIIASRYNDIRNNTHIVDNVLAGYKKAWAKRGMISENGLFRKWYQVNQNNVKDGQEISHSAWIMAYMPWNYAQIKSMYHSISKGFLQRIDDRINIRQPLLANEIRRVAAERKEDADSPAVLEQARRNVKEGATMQTSRSPLPTFGFVAQWLSEVGGPADLDPLLRHADQFLRPSWHKGGLYYARDDATRAKWDDDGNYLHMEPYSGNAAIGYARLNVQDGQKKMFDQPWTKEEVLERPCVEGVGLESGVDFLRGVWLEEKRCMVLGLRSWDGNQRELEVVVKMVPAGRYGTYVDGKLKGVDTMEVKGKDISFKVSVGATDVDVVVANLGV